MNLMNQIENIKNQISTKIKLGSKFDRDYIVFRPKQNLPNPILSKQSNTLTSIFQLENKRNNKAFLLRIRSNHKQRQENRIQIQEHLHIQRCRTFKKIKTCPRKTKHKIAFANTLYLNQKPNRQTNPNSKKINLKTTNKAEHKLSCILSNRYQKNIFEETLAQQLNIKIGHKQNQNRHNKTILSIRRPTTVQTKYQEFETPYSIRFMEKTNIVKKTIQSHQRYHTQIPPIFTMKGGKNLLQNHCKSPLALVEQAQPFKPWQTSQNLQKQDSFFAY